MGRKKGRKRKMSDTAVLSEPKKHKIDLEGSSYEFENKWQVDLFQNLVGIWSDEPRICQTIVLFLDDPLYWEATQIFEKLGTLGESRLDPLSSSGLTKGWGRRCVKKPAFPPEFAQMLRRGSKWSLGEDPWGLHMSAFTAEEKSQVFGDELKMWHQNCHVRVKNVKISCATPDWLYFAYFSEYDYLFVNINSKSPQFGAVRHIVNNCCSDDEFTDAPFSNFVELVNEYAKAYAKKKEDENEDGKLWWEFSQCDAVQTLMHKRYEERKAQRQKASGRR